MENRPVLSPGLDVYLLAYNELSFDRPVGMDVGFIPWSSIVRWCELHHIYDIDEITTFIRFMRALEKKEREIFERKNPA